MSKKTAWNKATTLAHQIHRYFWFKKDYKHRYKNLALNNIPLRRLTKEQKLEIKKVWGRLCLNDYATHELIYSITGDFNPYYCSALTFGTILEFALNDDVYKEAWSDKNFFDLHFPNVKFPHTIIRNVCCSLYDHEYNEIDTKRAIEILSAYNSVVIKPSRDTGTGRGVKLISVDEATQSIQDSRMCDYLIQELLEQYEPIEELNPSSVNIIRLNSLFINGKCSFLSASLRVGAAGSFTDNSTTPDGRGIIIIGITEDGTLKDHAYYPCGERIEVLPSKVDYKGLKIPNFDKVKDLAQDIHRKMPFAKYVGFDIAFDKDGLPVVMEYNINAPGVFYYQLANGPLFADRTSEIIETFS